MLLFRRSDFKLILKYPECDRLFIHQFDKKSFLDESLEKIGISIVSSNTETLYLAGQLWLEYKKLQNSRERILPDFIIGAFAIVQGDRLITRDRGFYGDYFKGLYLPMERRCTPLVVL